MVDETPLGIKVKRLRDRYVTPKEDADLKVKKAYAERENARLSVEIKENEVIVAKAEQEIITQRYSTQRDNLARVLRTHSLSDEKVRILSLYYDRQNSQRKNLIDEVFERESRVLDVGEIIYGVQQLIPSFPWDDTLVKRILAICRLNELDERNKKENGGEFKADGIMSGHYVFSEPRGKEIEKDLKQVKELLDSHRYSIKSYLSDIFYRRMNEATYQGLLKGRIEPFATLEGRVKAIEQKLNAPRLNKDTPSDGELLLAHALSHTEGYKSPKGRFRTQKIAETINELFGGGDYRDRTQVSQWLTIKGYKERYSQVREKYLI